MRDPLQLDHQSLFFAGFKEVVIVVITSWGQSGAQDMIAPPQSAASSF
jgi:hypothetical protein